MSDNDESTILGMSDEEAMQVLDPSGPLSGSEPEVKSSLPEVDPNIEAAAQLQEAGSGGDDDPEQKADIPPVLDEGNGDEASVLDKPDEEIGDGAVTKDRAKAPKEPAKEEPKSEDKGGEDKGTDGGKTPEVVAEPINYQAEYEKLLGPFRASGRTVQAKNVDEAMTMMQRGVDYTRKMQQLKPNLKLMKMLEKNGLMNEEKLTFLIDLDKNDPAAVNKFIKDKSIDPFDLDPNSETEYKPGKHSVSDEEMRFDSVLQDVRNSDNGQETITFIEKNWDQESMNVLYREPELLKLMDEHRSDGILEQITSEMAHRQMLGQLPENTPYLTLYKSIGDELHTSGKLMVRGVPTNSRQPAKVQAQVATPKPERQVLETRPAKPKPQASNGAAAKAAGSVRSSPVPPKASDFNPLAMSDEEFEKQSGNFRL